MTDTSPSRHEIAAMIAERYGCHAVLLYGSRARGDHDSTSGDDLLDASPQNDKNNFDIVLNLATGTWSGDANYDLDADQDFAETEQL